MVQPLPDALSASALVRETVELVDIPSVSYNEGALVDHLEACFRAIPALVVDRIGDNLVARTDQGRAERLLLGGHADTVPPSGDPSARVSPRSCSSSACHTASASSTS